MHRNKPEVLEPIERASRDELQALQLQRLRWSLQHAYTNVAHYRQAFASAGVEPGDLQDLSDLDKFPFLHKRDLRQHYPFGLFAVPRNRLRRLHASSGTTGKPTVVGYTERDLRVWAQVVARSIHAAGGRPGDVVHVAYGYGLFTGGLGAHYGAEMLGCTVVPVSGGNTSRQVQLINDFKPDIIMVTPSYMQHLIEEFRRQGLDPRASSLRAGIFGAEPWSQAMREDLEANAGLDALDIYGLSEVIGPGVASECVESKDGPVIWEDHFYPEIIDPDSGQVLPDGSHGELVITSLTKEALPVVRYRTGDLTRLLPPTSRGMRRLDRISGRSDDMLIIRGVNLFPSQIEELILHSPALAPQYQLVVTRAGLLDELEVRVEARPDRPEALSGDNRQVLERELRARIKAEIGVSVRVHVVPADGIERSPVGKARRVLDLRLRASGNVAELAQ
ncbi:MAG TPA: phenylacetate--CoA ligase PaaK [Stenotrophomonas sp.]|nr:phenylacetate--CoA ligase PaaK [Stenotrophomonas sp.]